MKRDKTGRQTDTHATKVTTGRNKERTNEKNYASDQQIKHRKEATAATRMKGGNSLKNKEDKIIRVRMTRIKTMVRSIVRIKIII